jgi:hypothetical protein
MSLICLTFTFLGFSTSLLHWVSGFRVSGFRFRVCYKFASLGFRVSSFGFKIRGKQQFSL